MTQSIYNDNSRAQQINTYEFDGIGNRLNVTGTEHPGAYSLDALLF